MKANFDVGKTYYKLSPYNETLDPNNEILHDGLNGGEERGITFVDKEALSTYLITPGSKFYWVREVKIPDRKVSIIIFEGNKGFYQANYVELGERKELNLEVLCNLGITFGTALSWAVINDHLDIVKCLIEPSRNDKVLCELAMNLSLAHKMTDISIYLMSLKDGGDILSWDLPAINYDTVNKLRGENE